MFILCFTCLLTYRYYIGDKIGTFKPGKEADFIVIDTESTPYLEYRQKNNDIFDLLFILITLGSEDNIKALNLWKAAYIKQKD